MCVNVTNKSNESPRPINAVPRPDGYLGNARTVKFVTLAFIVFEGGGDIANPLISLLCCFFCGAREGGVDIPIPPPNLQPSFTFLRPLADQTMTRTPYVIIVVFFGSGVYLCGHRRRRDTRHFEPIRAWQKGVRLFANSSRGGG